MIKQRWRKTKRNVCERCKKKLSKRDRKYKSMTCSTECAVHLFKVRNGIAGHKLMLGIDLANKKDKTALKSIVSDSKEIEYFMYP